jgi:predicted DNA-binding protein
MKSYEEIANEIDLLKDTDQELEGLVPVKVRGNKKASVVYSLRLSIDEFSRISSAAKKNGLTVAAYLRNTALAAADDKRKLEEGERAAALQEVREKTDQLAEAVGRL